MPTIEQMHQAGEPPLYIVQRMDSKGVWRSIGQWSQSRERKLADFQRRHDEGETVRVQEEHVIAQTVRLQGKATETGEKKGAAGRVIDGGEEDYDHSLEARRQAPYYGSGDREKATTC